MYYRKDLCERYMWVNVTYPEFDPVNGRQLAAYSLFLAHFILNL